MFSFKRRLTITAVTIAMASTAMFAASPASASAKCMDPNKQQVGPFLVQASSENTSRVDVCSKIDLGTYWTGINGQTGKFGVFNIKYADNKFFVLQVEDVTALGLGSSNQNPTGTFG